MNGLTEYWGNSYGVACPEVKTCSRRNPWGNLLQKTPTKCSAENLGVSVNTQNQMHTGTSPDYAYDAAGNMTHDATTGNNYSYDAENRITGAAGYAYTYDADGNRVEKSNGSTGTIYWYMSPGIVAESDLSGNLKSEYVFFDGERVARKDFPSNSVSYYFSDHLKTASVITDSAGNIKEDEDYYPWGGELQFVNNDSNHYKFTGKERDSETQLDYFGARYYGNWLGRFVTPDWSSTPIPVPYADFSDPQSLNQYSYVRNVPTNTGDLDGHQMQEINERDGEDTLRRRSPSDCPGLSDCNSSLAPSPPQRSTAGNIAIGVGKEAFNEAKPLLGTAMFFYWLQDPTKNTDWITLGTGILSMPDLQAANPTQDKTMRVTWWLSLAIPIGAEAKAESKASVVMHHIATNKNSVFTPVFEKLFAKFGITLDHEANKMPVSTLFHNSKHPASYHRFILDTLLGSTSGKTGAAGERSLIRALDWLRNYIDKNPTILE